MHFIMILLFIVPHAQCVEIQETIVNYFKSDDVRSFRVLWKKYEISYESAFLTVLRENYGHDAMNVYVRTMYDMRVIAQAFYVSDNVLDVLMKDLRVVHLPILTTSEVDIDLDTNVVRFKGVLTKIIVQAKYRLLRNHTAVVFSGSHQNLHKTSPFSLQQVQNTGQISIIADGCRLNGLAIAKLSGMSVNLGHNTFVVDNCDLNIEIWTPGLGSPPIIAPYFSKKQGNQLEQLLSKPMREELMPKLQAAMYSYINTSVIFGKDLPKFRVRQSKLFQETSTHLRNVVMAYNKLAVDKGKDTFTLANKRIAWTEKIKARSQSFDITISDVTLYGLETAYLSHNGGPYQHKTIKIEDEIRFNNLQVRGQITVQSNVQEQRNFGAELHDVVVNMVIDVDAKQLTLQRLEVVGWRAMELNHFEIESISSRSLLTGYLTNEIPIAVSKQIKDMFVEALKQTDKNSQIDLNGHFKYNENSDESKDQNDEENVPTIVDNKQNNTDENIETSKDENYMENNNENADRIKIKFNINKGTDNVLIESPEDNNSENKNDASHNTAEESVLKVKLNINKGTDNVLIDSPEENDSKNKNDASHKTSDEGVLKLKLNINKENTDDLVETSEDKNNNESGGDAFHQNPDNNVMKIKLNINEDDNDDERVETAEGKSNDENRDDTNQNDDKNKYVKTIATEYEKNDKNVDDASFPNADEDVKLKNNINKNNDDKSQENGEQEYNSETRGEASYQINLNNNKYEKEADSADKRKYIKKSLQRKYNNISEDTRNKFIKRKSMYTFRGIPMSDNEIHTES